MKKGLKISIIAGMLAVIAGVSALYAYKLFKGPQICADDHFIYVDTASNVESVFQDIAGSEPEGNLKGLKILMGRESFSLKTGCYSIRKGDSALDIYRRLASGNQTPVRVTIRSQRTTARMAHDISVQLMLDSATVYQLLTDPAGLDSIGYSPATVYCLIVPNTYEFYWNVTPEAFMARMLKEHNAFWTDERRAKADAIGLTPEQVVTLASIVEEETAKTDEMPVVAGLYMNRLHKGMPLQADPTVIFALGGERPKRVLNEHLKVQSPYNTYLNTGLPPAPIRYVSISAINSVLNYTRHNYLYMCAREDFSGYHNFAVTLSQHNANATRYRRALSRLAD